MRRSVLPRLLLLAVLVGCEDSATQPIRRLPPRLVHEWGTQGTGDGQFGVPDYEFEVLSIAIGSDGDLYIADPVNDRVQRFTAWGQYKAKWGSSGSEDGQFRSPNAIDVDDADNVYVLDSALDRQVIQEFDSNGTFISRWDVSGAGNDIAVDGPGNVYLPTYDSATGYSVSKIERVTDRIVPFADPDVRYILSIACDDIDNVYVSGALEDDSIRLFKYDRMGNALQAWEIDKGTSLFAAGGYVYAGGQQFTDEGTLVRRLLLPDVRRFVVDATGTIHVMLSQEGRVQQYAGSRFPWPQ